MSRSKCKSGKVRHRTMVDALLAATRAQDWYKVDMRVYRCPLCNGFHTSRKRKEE